VVRKTWVVVADRSRARIFSVDSPRGPLHEIEDLVHPESRAHERDLTSDRPGRASDQHVLNAAHSARDQQANEFAREIVDCLEGGRINGGFERLVLVAAPDLLGLLRKALNGQLSKLVSRTIDKNLTQQDAREIRRLLPTFL
jgi:protein required for attachment to host cells